MIIGPRGEPGPKGDDGDEGPKGVDGSCDCYHVPSPGSTPPGSPPGDH